MKNGRAIAHCERQKLRHRLWDFCAREMRRLDSLETSKEECRSKSGLTQAVRELVPYGSELDFICWVLGDTGLDGEFAQLGRLSAHHS
jgi:hypothetical protein